MGTGSLILLKRNSMKRTYITTILTMCLGCFAYGQDGVGINTSPALADPSAMLEVKSTSRGILIPRIALASRPAASSVPAGLMIYNTTDKVFNYSNGSVWITFPVAFISQIQDKDLDTYVTAEKTADEDILRFATGQSGSAMEVAQITKTGINLNYNAGSEYLYESNRVIAQNKASQTLASGAGSFPVIESSNLPNTVIGSNAMSTSSLIAGSNVVVGANAGKVLASSNNTIIGYNASKSLTSGTENTVIGAGAQGSSVLGNKNVIIGQGAGLLATNDSLVIIGKDAGSSLTTGRNNILIGTNVQATTPTSNNVVALGSVIKADASSKKVTFHNSYTFPGTAGSNGDLLVLGAGNQLNWGGRISRQVAGVMADIKPFDAKIASSSMALSSIYFIKLTSYATADLAFIATSIVANTLVAPATATLEMGIYNSAGAKLGSISKTVSAGTTGSIPLALASPISVVSGQVLYLAISCSSTALTFPYLAAPLSPVRIQALGVLPATMTLPGVTDPNNIFINAY